MGTKRINQSQAARQLGCADRTVRRYVAAKWISTDSRGRVLLAEVRRVAGRKLKHGFAAIEVTDRKQASRVLHDVLETLIRTKDSSKAAARFIKGAQTGAWQQLPDNPPLEQDLVRNGLSRVQTLVLAARFIREYSRLDTHNSSLLARPTQREILDALEVAGGLKVYYVPGKGAFVKHGTDAGDAPTRNEAIKINEMLSRTALSSHAKNASRSSLEQRVRKRAYTLAMLCGWSRQRCNYWRRRTDTAWPSFCVFCSEVVKQGAAAVRELRGDASSDIPDDTSADGWDVKAYLESESTKGVSKSRSTISYETEASLS
jgi:hypothetical protein